LAEALLLLTPTLGERVRHCLAVVDSERTLYLEPPLASQTNLSPSLVDSLPKKRISAGALFLNEQGQFLVVNPTYKPQWGIPGGIVEADESPRAACQREVQEELGLVKSCERLLSVAYVDSKDEQADSLKFFFWGGVLAAAEIAQICLPVEELSEYCFVDPVEAPMLSTERMDEWMRQSLAILPTQQLLYLE
jgi:ADP-ribose pyrophosphatase YjhB (NUDIX family)